MTLSQIMKLALRQLDEDTEDISEYDDLFKTYLNSGYAIAVRGYLRPRETRMLTTNAEGEAFLNGLDIERIISLSRREEDGKQTEAIPFALTGDGRGIKTGIKDGQLEALCEVRYPELTLETDEPRLPEDAQPALADYICYRHLSSGNLAKQSRAQFFLTSFYQAMQRIRGDGMGSVTRAKNLYEVTDIRYRG